jgi:V8-like Glu-specific endopeptidase
VRLDLTGRGWSLVGITSVALGCSDPAAVHTGHARDGLIYGEDTRRDVYAVDSAQLAQIAVQSTIAFMSAEHLVSNSTGKFEIVSDSLGASNNLCSGEAFEAQPAAASCSGVLVDDRLVLTAGHCIRDNATCDDQLLVFDYAITAHSSVIAVDADAVYRCKSIPARGHGVDPDGRRWDYAFVELERPVSSARRPVQITTEALPVGSHLTVIGYPSGLPAKVDSGAELLYQRPCMDYFTLDSDTFQSSSGSGVFDDRGRLAGIFVRGGIDYEFVPDRGCAVSRRIAEVADLATAEQASYLAPAIASLCETGWVSDRLCAASADGARAGADRPAASCMSETPVADDSGCSTAGRRPGGRSSGSAFVTMLIAALAGVARPRRRARAPAAPSPTSRRRNRATGVRIVLLPFCYHGEAISPSPRVP